MEKILAILGVEPNLKNHKDDSLTDRCNHKITVTLLLLLVALVSAKQYVGDPINCWVPAHFDDTDDLSTYEDYVNHYCWIKNTYYLPFSKHIPHAILQDGEKREMITYYQWVPLVLLVQALLFYLPCMVWTTYNARSGVDISNLVDTCTTFQLLEKAENKNKALDHLTKQMFRFVDSQRDYTSSMTFSIKNVLSRTLCFACGRRKGNYLVTLYLFVKFLYISNLAGQFFLMKKFLGTDYLKYGIKFFTMLYKKEENELNTPAFPRVTMCDFNIRFIGNVHRYTVQCVLPINLFNEIIYLFLWWWIVLLGVASVISFISWLNRIVNSHNRTVFVKKHLMLLNRIDPASDSTDMTNPSPARGDYLEVELLDCSNDLLLEYVGDSAGSAQSDPPPLRINTDKYHHLKELVHAKYGKWKTTISLNPLQDEDLLHEILSISPRDSRKVFKVTGGNGHILSDNFINELHQDGVFVLRIVGNNTNTITTTEVVCALWDRFCERHYVRKNKSV